MATKTESLRYLIEAIWKGGGATAAASKSIEDVGKSAKNTDSMLSQLGKGWASLATPVNQTLEIIGKVGQAFKDAWAFLGEGAELSRAEEVFGNLANSIGTSADTLLAKMGEASSGMMSNANMMVSASDIIRLGLADTEDGVVRLSNLVARSGWDMQQVIMTFANDSKMRLDALGLSVTDVEARIKKYTDAGMDASEAFDLAVIEAGEDKLLLLGDAAESTAGKMRILEASFVDLGGSFQQAVSDVLLGDLFGILEGTGAIEGDATRFGTKLGTYVGRGISAGLALLTLPVGGIFSLLPSLKLFTEGMRDMAEPDKIIDADAFGWSMEGIAESMERGAAAAERFRERLTGQRTTGQRGGLMADLLFGLSGDPEESLTAMRNMFDAAQVQIAGMRAEAAAAAAAVAAKTARRQEFGGFVDFDTAGMGDANAVLLETATTAGAAAEQLYVLAGGGQAAGDALIAAAGQARAAQLGEAVAAGLITAKDAMTDLQDFMDGLTLEDVFKMDEPIAGAGEAVETAKQEMLRVVEGIEPAVAEAAAPALEAVSAVDEALKLLDEVTATPEIQDNAADSQENLTEYRRYWDANIAGLSTTHTINIQYVTEGMPPGAPPPGRAMGGPVLPGSPYVVGEKGPELFIPKAAGDIVPASVGSAGAWGASAPAVVVQNFNGLGVGGAVAVARRTLANYTRGTR